MSANIDSVRFENHVDTRSNESDPTVDNKPNKRVYIKPKINRSRRLSNSGSRSLQKSDSIDREHRLIPDVSHDWNGQTNIVNAMGEIGHSMSEINKRWQYVKQDIDSTAISPSSPIVLVLSTDPDALEVETDRTVPEELPLGSEEAESLPSILEGLKINLSGDDLPQDIVALLIEKVPAAENEIDRFFGSDYTKPLQKLYRARSLLEALPTWQVIISKSHAQLAESIFNQVQEELVDRILLSVSDIFSKVSTRLDNGDVRLNLNPLAEALVDSVLQLQKVRFSERLAPRWPDLNTEFRRIGIKSKTLLQYLGESSPRDVTGTGYNWQDIRPLPPVYFVVRVLREDAGLAKSQGEGALSVVLPMRSVNSLLI